jgi:hypothetical protein
MFPLDSGGCFSLLVQSTFISVLYVDYIQVTSIEWEFLDPVSLKTELLDRSPRIITLVLPIIMQWRRDITLVIPWIPLTKIQLLHCYPIFGVVKVVSSRLLVPCYSIYMSCILYLTCRTGKVFIRTWG